ncbi:MAG: HlyD family efflux transporter periplasmic adaptor subunit [Acidobacteria bacterium]|nr:HlyD family efflux transporter periplasmic adaptor subunit [Acidobacteriota bacterium]MBI3472652.1 HlyD family efflux transporter periplasmic adaptor subunit [Candidatus Solibacter usitatus]
MASKHFFLASAILAGTLAAVGLSQSGEKKAAQSSVVKTAKATSGPIERTLRVTGSTQARDYVSVAAPMMRGPDAGRALILIFLVKSGAMVKKGEMLAQIDGQSMKDHVDDLDALIIQAEADIKKRKAEQAIDWENLQQTLRVTKAEMEKAKLDLSASEVRFPIDQEILKMNVEELEAQQKEQLADLKTKQEAYKSEIRILEITKERHKRHRDRHTHDLERFTLYAPIEGLAVMQSIWRSGEMAQISQGDQIAPGQPFMKVVDPRSMQIEALVSQVAADDVRIGQEATVRFDAFPELLMKGKVHSIGALATGGFRQNNYLRTLPVRLAILGSDRRVIPDLSTSAEIVIERKDKAVLVPVEALQAHAGKRVVWVRKGDRYEPRDIRVGITSNTHAEIAEGLQAGEEVALEPPPVQQPKT